MIDNKIDGVLESTILKNNGMSIISAYQYMSSSQNKFLNGLDDTRSTKAEAEADAHAALNQAREVMQPEGSAIYFGDFDLMKENADLTNACLEYFQIVKGIVGNHYALGVYGNGYTNRILRAAKLVSYSWISGSRSFEEMSEFYNCGQWHLFQHQVDRRWFETGKCPRGIGIDANIQNPQVSDIGAWGNGGVEPARTVAIFEQRRFALRTTPVYVARGKSSGLINKKRCKNVKHHWIPIVEDKIKRNNSVRVLSVDGIWAHVDLDDDGVSDGYCLAADLTSDLKTMPPW